MKNSTSKVITDCIGAVALSFILILLSAYIPVLTMPILFVLGMPTAYIILKHGVFKGGVTAIAILLVAGLSPIGYTSTAIIFIICVLPSVIFTLFAKKNKDTETDFYTLVTSVAALYLAVFFMLLIFVSGDKGVYGFLSEIMSGMGDSLKNYISGTAVSGMGIEVSDGDITRILSQTFEDFIKYLPTILIGTSAVVAYISVKLNAFVMNRLKVCSVVYPKFYEIAAPRFMCGFMILLYIAEVVTKDGSMSNMTVANLYMLTMLAFAVCGMSAIDGVLKRHIDSDVLRCLLYFVILSVGFSLVGIIMEFLALWGFIDTMNGFRRFLIDVYNSKIVGPKDRESFLKDKENFIKNKTFVKNSKIDNKINNDNQSDNIVDNKTDNKTEREKENNDDDNGNI